MQPLWLRFPNGWKLCRRPGWRMGACRRMALTTTAHYLGLRAAPGIAYGAIAHAPVGQYFHFKVHHLQCGFALGKGSSVGVSSLWPRGRMAGRRGVAGHMLKLPFEGDA